ncbi:MAG TPA: STAS domain-containing protein [Tepidisphaeraceae bacterium]|nr:STAS domain-containing protein [Tepidisphaeraceae bacterium]
MAHLRTTQLDGVAVLRLDGALGHAEVVEVERAFRDATAAAGAAMVIDLSGVNFLGTAGIALLLEAAQTLKRAGGKVVVGGAQPRVAEVLKRLRLERVLPITQTVEAGVALAKP